VADNVPDQVRRIPKLGVDIPATVAEGLRSQLTQLAQSIAELRRQDDPKIQTLLPDIEIFHRAVGDALTYQEFFRVEEFEIAEGLLREAMGRAEQLQRGEAPWTTATGLIVRGYRSRIDGSVQPYGLVIPPTYRSDATTPTRLDIWFHGRGETLSEVNFLHERTHQAGVFTPEDAIVLHPYGRYCNAFKFAGEVDVLEALDAVRGQYRVDDDRISVRGFSMGGAACWQFAVHYADRWFAANPGAGFAETPRFLESFQKEQLQPTWFERKLWRLYDCDLWAENLAHCPTVAYSGEEDVQKQAADVMEAALRPHGMELVHVLGPKTGHRYHPDAAQEVAVRLDALARAGRERVPRSVRFTTYSLRYHRMGWVDIEGLGEHWERAHVNAERVSDAKIVATTENVTDMTLRFEPGELRGPLGGSFEIVLDGVRFTDIAPRSDRSLEVSFHQADGAWKAGRRSDRGLSKHPGLQGPIDDAFMDSFLFVRPTGQTSQPQVAAWAAAEMDRAVEHWRRHFRGQVRQKDDIDVTAEDIASSHLILWGDVQNNQVLRNIALELPIRWTSDKIVVGDQQFLADHHGVIAIYPNPLHRDRYIVINSGFTFRDFAYLNNARQVPKLPDWAIVDIRTPPDALWPGKIVAADFFDEKWQLKPQQELQP
jgi:hypothetical protein